MKLPLQISFRNMKPSQAVEARICEEVAKLETRRILWIVGIVSPRKPRAEGVKK